jgi:hypothetical protein
MVVLCVETGPSAMRRIKGKRKMDRAGTSSEREMKKGAKKRGENEEEEQETATEQRSIL